MIDIKHHLIFPIAIFWTLPETINDNGSYTVEINVNNYYDIFKGKKVKHINAAGILYTYTSNQVDRKYHTNQGLSYHQLIIGTIIRYTYTSKAGNTIMLIHEKF